MQAVLGLVVFVGFAWLLSDSRRRVNWRMVAVGLCLQALIGLLLLKAPLLSDAVLAVNGVVQVLAQATQAGTSFVFGYLGGGRPPFQVREESAVYLFAFRVLPQILIVSVLAAVFWHWRILPAIIRGVSAVLRRFLGIGGAVGAAAAASVFLSMVEAPLVIRAYLTKLSRSELFTVMTCGMATVSGAIMVLYAGILQEAIAGALGHIVVASIMNVVGAIMVSRVMIPPPNSPELAAPHAALSYASTLDAITRGTADGLRLVVNVGAMLIVLVALVALVNQGLGLIEVYGAPLTLERMMGWAFAPLAWLMGIPWGEAQTAGSLLGAKLVLNELVAYLQLAALDADVLSAHTGLMLTYALCGFTNFGSLGILLGGLSAMVPERRGDLLNLGPKTLISGTLVSCFTGTLSGLIGRLP